MLGLLASLGPSGAAQPASTIVVQTTSQHSTTACTLSDAIVAVNYNVAHGACPTGAGVDTILVPEGHYVLTQPYLSAAEESTGLPPVQRAVRIVGDGPGLTRIERAPDAPAFRLLKVQAPFVLEQLTLAGGHSDYNRGGGALLVDRFDVAANIPVHVRHVVFENNYAPFGGALADTGFFAGPFAQFTVEDSFFTLNRASHNGAGIFVSSGSTLTVRRSRFEDNVAGEWGGGIGTLSGSDVSLDVTGSQFLRNTATQNGGAIYATSPRIATSVFQDNWVRDRGGALSSDLGRPIVRDSSFIGNRAGEGGAIYVLGGSVEISGSTLAGNVAAGAGNNSQGSALSLDERSGTSRIENSTVSGNRSEAGGAIYVPLGTLTLRNVTVAFNTNLGTPGSWSVGIRLGFSSQSVLRLANSIVAANTSDGYPLDIYFDPSTNERIESLGHNLIGTSEYTAGAFVQPGDRTGSPQAPLDPGLLALANNGGQTLTHALGPASPARDAGSPEPVDFSEAACLAIDQRGVARPGPGTPQCDIGAFEAYVFVDTTAPSAVITAPAEIGFGVPLVVSGAASSDIGGQIAGYIWQLDDHPPIELAAPDPTIEFDPIQLAMGLHTVSLIVVDDSGNRSDPATAHVLVRDLSAPVAVLAAPVSIVAGTPLQVSGASSYDIGGRIALYVWQLDRHAPVEVAAPTATFQFDAALLDPGSHTIQLTVVDDAGNRSATVDATVEVVPATTLSLLPSAPTSARGEPVTFKAQVAPVPPATGTPTGEVVFTHVPTGTTLGTVALDADGWAVLTTRTLPEGTFTIAAAYAGDASFAGSSATVVHVVVPAPYAAIRNGDPEPRPEFNGVGMIVRAPGLPGCTGTLVAESVVLTAAQCVREWSAGSGYEFTLGPGRTAPVTGVYIHPFFDYPRDVGLNLAFDVALVTIDREIASLWTDAVPATLLADHVPVGASATAVGVGRSSAAASPARSSGALMVNGYLAGASQGGVPINDAFIEAAPADTRDQMFCPAGVGGPLFYQDRIAGVASFRFVESCAEPGPGYYVTMGRLAAWVEATIAEASANTPPGANVTVTAGPDVTATFDQVIEGGQTTATSGDVPPPPGGFEHTTPPVTFDLSTTARFTGPVQVCVIYPSQAVGPRLMHFEGGRWVDRTTLDDLVSRRVCGSVTSLSPFAVFVPDGLPGHMTGHGALDAERHVRFEFRVAERRLGRERGRVALTIKTPRSGREQARTDRFRSHDISSIVFLDDPGFRPGRRLRPQVDWAAFSGTGTWNGTPGYTFDARAIDAGEPGRGRDRLSIVIRDPAGRVVHAFDTTIAQGNINSHRLGGGERKDDRE